LNVIQAESVIWLYRAKINILWLSTILKNVEGLKLNINKCFWFVSQGLPEKHCLFNSFGTKYYL